MLKKPLKLQHFEMISPQKFEEIGLALVVAGRKSWKKY
jgi:hypothetical protein